MSAVLDPHDHTHGDAGHDEHHAHPAGWRRWVYATNHKDIGTLYLLFSFFMFMFGGVLALGIRAELFQPGLQLVNPELFNQLTTMHGLIMVFGAIMPAFVGFANWMIPLQIGASDMAFARMNNFSFWLLVPAGLMLMGSFLMPGGAPSAGWTLYAPLTLQMGPSMDAGIFAMHILGASSIMGSINIIVTMIEEVIWTIIPFVIVIGMALPATKVLVAAKDTSNADITIKATGYQWKWGYDYLNGEGQGVSFLSALDSSHRAMSNQGALKERPDDYLLAVDNPLVVPVNKKVRIITTANDVIHAWGVPAFGVKQDAIPGFVRDTWFRSEKTGDFYGNCYELCGKEHAYMPIHVKVVSAQEYSTWVAGEMKKVAARQDDPSKVWTLTDIVARGEKVYAANCAACHQASGKGAGPIKALDGSPVVVDADKTPSIHVLLNGRGAMPAWKQLSDTDIAAVISYTKNNWSNKTGQVVQPAEVLAQRGR